MKFGLFDIDKISDWAAVLNRFFPREQFSLYTRGENETEQEDLIPGSKALSPETDEKWSRRSERLDSESDPDFTEALGELLDYSETLGYQLENWLSTSSAGANLPVRGDITPDLELNLRRMRRQLNASLSTDVIVRRFRLASAGQPEALVIYLEGMTDGKWISESVLEPLMLLAPVRTGQQEMSHPPDAADAAGGGHSGEHLREQVLRCLTPNNQAELSDNIEQLVQGILTGQSAILVEGQPWGLLLETKGYEFRAIEKATTEQVVRGPKESFTESQRVNTSLIRRRLRTGDLVVESVTLGSKSKTEVAVLYLRDIADQRLVDEVGKRLRAIDIDYLPDSGLVEQMIEDNPNGLWPTTLATERPDRVAAYLSEGHVAILSDNSPFAIVMPATFTTWFHAAEDYYVRWPYGMLLRLIRVAGILTNLYLPAFYIAAATYHQEMMPTPLLLAIADAREAVPFPLLLEVLIMEFSFDLIREAGIRIPSVIGPTLGIVGALILGQAAVQASLVSPVVVIIVSITALGSFTIPNYSFALTTRMLHYVMMFAAAVLGLYGIALISFLLVVSFCSSRSFGIPLSAPVSPQKPGSPDVVMRAPIYQMERRPAYVHPEDPVRQDFTQRTWDATVEAARATSNDSGRGRDDG